MTEKEADAAGYLTLEEVEAGRRTKFMAVFPTVSNRRAVLKAMADLIAAGEKSLSVALDKAGDNTDNGSHYLCRFDLRVSVGRVLARAASELNTAKAPSNPAAIVRHALDTLETPRPKIGRPSVAQVLAVA